MSSVASMRKWGIPDVKKKAPEITLLERLVWVRYQTHWWPALLYHGYTELQHHMYDQLDMVLKAQFAMAIMRQMQEKRKVQVARLLGRSILEVVEVEEDCYCEFYWQLPNVLPKACKRSRYGDNEELYFDFHRALDQVEDIIREVSQENFALLPHDEQKSWVERAQIALDDSHTDDDQSTVSRFKKVPTRVQIRNQQQQQQQQRIPDIPRNRSLESKSSTIATNDVGLWDTMMTNISRSFESYANNEESQMKDPATKVNEELATRSKRNEENFLEAMALTKKPGSRKKNFPPSNSWTKKAPPSNSWTKKAPPSNSHETPAQSVNGRSRLIKDVKRTGSKVSHAASSVSSRSHSSRIQPSSNLQNPRKSSVDTTLSRRSGMSKKSGGTEQINNLTSKREEFESRDPPSESAAQTTPSTPCTAIVVRQTGPVDVLPGLEGDDIMEGLSRKVEHARDIWTNVLSTMLMNKESEDPSGVKHVGDLSTLPELREGVTTLTGTVDAPQKEPEERVCVEAAVQNLTFWQRLTCDAV
jgi:hypothetical protein